MKKTTIDKNSDEYVSNRNDALLISITKFLKRPDHFGPDLDFDFNVRDSVGLFREPLEPLVIEVKREHGISEHGWDLEHRGNMGLSFGFLNKLSEIFGTNVMDIEWQPISEVTQVPWTAEIIGWKFRLPRYNVTLPIFNIPLDKEALGEDWAEIWEAEYGDLSA